MRYLEEFFREYKSQVLDTSKHGLETENVYEYIRKAYEKGEEKNDEELMFLSMAIMFLARHLNTEKRVVKEKSTRKLDLNLSTIVENSKVDIVHNGLKIQLGKRHGR